MRHRRPSHGPRDPSAPYLPPAPRSNAFSDSKHTPVEMMLLAYAPAPRTGCLPGDLTPALDDAMRADDLALLRALVPYLASAVEAYDLPVTPCADPDDERDVEQDEGEERTRLEGWLVAFSDMLAKLGSTSTRVLSPKQRAWAVQAAERLDVAWGDPGARNP